MCDVLALIDTIFETNNIYQSFVLYRSYQSDKVNDLALALQARDYPVKVYTNFYRISHVRDDMAKYRMFFIPIEQLHCFMLIWGPYYHRITFVLYLGKQIMFEFAEMITIFRKPEIQITLCIEPDNIFLGVR